MMPKSSSIRRTAVGMTAAMVLSLGVGRLAQAQAPTPPATGSGYQEGGPIVPESEIPRDPAQGSRGRQATSPPVLTPGYFEVVCPAICYGGSFHVCNIRAFAGPGYYGPFRRYWAYSTYGPSWNIGPDNSLQYGLIGGVIYQAQRACKGCYKHGGDCACHCVFCAKGGGSLAGIYGPIGQSSSLQGGSQQPTGNLSQPTPNPAQQPAEKLPPPTGNTALLRLLVPANAEVLVEGSKTTTTGKVREFVSPPLEPGKNMIYSIVVRYTDASGKKVEETHSIRVHANARLDIDCTKPANAEQPRATALRP